MLRILHDGLGDVVNLTDEVGNADKIRKITTTGRGLGGESFMKRMEKKLKVTLRILKPGRKGAQ